VASQTRTGHAHWKGLHVIIDVRLTSMRSSGGEGVNFPRAGVTCVVGGNNVGKSRLLREIDAALQNEHFVTATFNDLQIDKQSLDVLLVQEFLDVVGVKRPERPGYPPEYVSMYSGQNFTVEDFIRHYQVADPCLGGAKPFFAWYASAGSLLGAASVALGGIGPEDGGHPLSRVYRNGELEDELSALAHASFGVPLTLDRINRNVRLRIGLVDVEVPRFDHPTIEYAQAVDSLSTLEDQGDGIKSFLGLALNVVAGSAQILLIDEPEAFLHPGQACALGRWLSREAVKRDVQVILATHDRDLLLGLIDGGANAVVNVVRLTRDNDVNHLRELPHSELAAVWKDPVLRYSNLLQGLFHGKVAICEADADCRFYGAVVDQLATEQNQRAMADDLLFVPSGGKQRIAAMAHSLARLGVRTYAIVDFDILRRRDDIRSLVEALGSTWSLEMDRDYIAVATSANERALWDWLKNQGVSGLPAGAVNASAGQLLGQLAAAGVYVVPVGEMEDFDKSIGLHGAAWVSAMLEANGHITCQPARTLVDPLIA
jgi:predicted ATPase